MQRSKQFLFMFLVFAMLLASKGVSWGQVIPTQLNLSTPGARSLGMGGAFLALADDATASYTNPAGLTSLTEGGPQVAVELRNWSYSTPYISQGRLDGSPTGLGLDSIIFSELSTAKAASDISDLSFFSLGYVLPRGFTLSLYKNQLANFSTSFKSEGWFFDPVQNRDEGITGLCFDVLGKHVCRTFPAAFEDRIKIDSIGSAIAYEFQRPWFSRVDRPLSVGVGIAHYQLKSFTGSARFNFSTLVNADGTANLLTDPRAGDGVLGRSQFLDGYLRSLSFEEGDDSAIGLTLGFLWKIGSKGGWTIGGVYREGPEFSTVSSVVDALEGSVFENTLKIPDTYGFGVSYSPPKSEGKTKLALDYQRIRYSQRLADHLTGLRRSTNLDIADFDIADSDFDIADSEELHLGLERVIVTSGNFVGTVRAGGWHESAHELRYLGSTNAAYQVLFPGGDAYMHWAAGVGLVIGESYQIDAAFDHSDRAKVFSFSVVRFF
jgi:long-chain fatty acid transport protein